MLPGDLARFAKRKDSKNQKMVGKVEREDPGLC